MGHNLDEIYGQIPESLQEKDECIICKENTAVSGKLACSSCIRKIDVLRAENE